MELLHLIPGYSAAKTVASVVGAGSRGEVCECPPPPPPDYSPVYAGVGVAVGGLVAAYFLGRRNHG